MNDAEYLFIGGSADRQTIRVPTQHPGIHHARRTECGAVEETYTNRQAHLNGHRVFYFAMVCMTDKEAFDEFCTTEEARRLLDSIQLPP